MPNENKQHQLDIHYMKRALRLAKKGQGKVSPNPLVGAVVVKNNQIIGEGYHQKYGDPHAEINAIKSAGPTVKDATLYSTLEPCCHSDKQTPPCTNRIIREGLRRVVVAGTDPNPKVDGKGLKILQDAGIEVEKDILSKENQDLNKFYYKFVKTRLPYVTLKVAQTIDGFISNDQNQQLWLTGERSKRLVHYWRSTYDSVLIGANTLRIDNPLLTVRYGKKRNPLRIIISGSTKIDPESQIFIQKPENSTWILTIEQNHSMLSKRLSQTGCKIIELSADSNLQLSILSVLEYLSKQKITSVLVEGGQQIFSQFIQSGFWDELNLMIAPKVLGQGIRSFNIETTQKLSSFHLHRTKKLGEDVLLSFLRK
jgi:diaminohydroxyphosphoribosylaminopyrimidine deaminase/5-amino-6-(5-phosphoribosylamino)uracil reductase